MSYIRVSEPSVAPVPIDDLGVTIGLGATVILTDQFSVKDLYLSADLEALIIAGDLDVEIDFGTGFTVVAAGDYTNRDTLSAFLNVYEITNENNNEDLVSGSEVNSSGPASAPLHIHDARYYTETEIGGTGGAQLVGVDNSSWLSLTGNTVQEVFDGIDGVLVTAVTLDAAYTNDVDGILNVNGTTKDLEFRSDDVNDVSITRYDLTNVQDALRFDVSGDELCLGSLVAGALPQVDVRVKTDLIVDGDITFTGSITDTTVDELNVTNSSIMLRDGAVAGADAEILVERGATGADACILWNETGDYWEIGIVGAKSRIVTAGNNELIDGVWCFGGDTTEPDLCLVEKAAAPTTELGAAGHIPMAMLQNGHLAVYDKSNSRNKWLSVDRFQYVFSGRDNANNTNEYARMGEFTSNQSSGRLIKDATLVGISIQTFGAETWTAEVRRNGVVTVIDSLGATAAAGAQNGAKNADFDAGDQIQVFINGTAVNRPLITLEFAYRF